MLAERMKSELFEPPITVICCSLTLAVRWRASSSTRRENGAYALTTLRWGTTLVRDEEGSE